MSEPSDITGIRVSASLTENPIAIRPITPADQEAARRLVLEGLAQHFGCFDQSMNPDLEDIRSSYLGQGHLFVVAVIEDQVVGTGGLLFSDHQRGQIVRISVAKVLRRRGIGRAIINYLIAVSRRNNLQTIDVETNLGWTEATRFYRNMGFVEHRRDSESVYLQFTLEES